MCGTLNIGYSLSERLIRSSPNTYRIPISNTTKSRQSQRLAAAPAPRRVTQRVSQAVGRPTNALSEIAKASLTYGDVFAITSAVGRGLQSFRLNSIYDPDSTGVGGQPTYYTQMAALWQQYLVRSVDVDIEFLNASAAAADVLCGFIWTPVNGGPVSTATEIQQKLLEGKSSAYKWALATATDGCKVRVTKHIDIANINGVKTLDDDYASNFGANPFAECNLDVVVIRPGHSADSVTAYAVVRITYNCEFRGLQTDTYLD